MHLINPALFGAIRFLALLAVAAALILLFGSHRLLSRFDGRELPAIE